MHVQGEINITGLNIFHAETFFTEVFLTCSFWWVHPICGSTLVRFLYPSSLLSPSRLLRVGSGEVLVAQWLLRFAHSGLLGVGLRLLQLEGLEVQEAVKTKSNISVCVLSLREAYTIIGISLCVC